MPIESHASSCRWSSRTSTRTAPSSRSTTSRSGPRISARASSSATRATRQASAGRMRRCWSCWRGWGAERTRRSAPLLWLSEGELHRELEVALRVGPEIRGGRDPPRVRIGRAGYADLRIGVAQVHVVEDVHRFDSQLECLGTAERDPLEHRRVYTPVAGPRQVVARQVAERADRRTAEGAPGRADRRRVEPLIPRARSAWIADEIGAVRADVAVGAAVTVGDVERQAALDDGALVELPSAQERIPPHPRQLVCRRDREAVDAIPVGPSVLQVRKDEELAVAVLALALERVLREGRPSASEALRELGLQRVVPVRRAVAVGELILVPAVGREERTPLIARNGGEADERRLVRLVVGIVAGEDPRTVVPDVADFQRHQRSDLALDRDVVRGNRRQPLLVREYAGLDAGPQDELAIRSRRRERRRRRALREVEHGVEAVRTSDVL